MGRKQILTVVGARPQFIKAAMVSKAFAAYESKDAVKELIIHTGQHFDREMSDNFFHQLQLPDPILNLKIHDTNRAAMVGKMITALDTQIKKIKPNLVLVYGDTDSTVAGALAASYNCIDVAHVEAGPRAQIKTQVEEINRVLVDHLATLNFCPTAHTAENLKAENIKTGVHIVGDVMLDAFQAFFNLRITPSISKPFALATLHRRENINDRTRLETALKAMSQIDMHILFPAHPRTRACIEGQNIQIPENVHLTRPISYFESIGALNDCEFVITDSGGLPKEAYFAGKRSLILNEFASWPELLDAGESRLTNISCDQIRDSVPWARQGVSNKITNLFGDARSSEKIVELVNAFVNGQNISTQKVNPTQLMDH